MSDKSFIIAYALSCAKPTGPHYSVRPFLRRPPQPQARRPPKTKPPDQIQNRFKINCVGGGGISIFVDGWNESYFRIETNCLILHNLKQIVLGSY